MAKGQHYSNHQRKIINRYYEHRDTIAVHKLSEIVSELYLNADSPKQADKLWQRAEKQLAHLAANDTRVRKVLDERNVQALAQLVNELA